MPRKMPVLLVVGFIAGFLATGLLAAGKIDSRTEVKRVLREGLSVPTDRREELLPIVESTKDAAPRWQAGLVKVGDEWKPFEEAVLEGRERDLAREYESRREQAGTTAEAQLELANWCRQRGLPARERAHLLAAVQAGPESGQAALLERLGYRQVRGEWLSGEQMLAWKTQFENIRRSVQLHGEKLQAIGNELAAPGERGKRTALAKLARFETAAAVPAIEWTLCGREEPVALEAVRALGRVDGYASSQALARQGVFNRSENVRAQAIEELLDRKLEDFVPELIPLLAPPTESGFSVVEQSRGVLVFNHILARETDDQFQVAHLQTVNFQIINAGTDRFGRQDRSTVASLAQSRAGNDATRRFVDEAYVREKLVAALNERTEEINGRVCAVLASVFGRQDCRSPHDWWHCWSTYNEMERSPKCVRRWEQRRVVGTPMTYPKDCFAAGTPIWTNAGKRSIETVRVGDLVLSQNVETGELGYAPVMQTTLQPPKPLWTLTVGGETFRVTGGHRFWENGSGWRRTLDLKPGGILHTARGSVAIEAIVEGEAAPSHNLVVDGTHNYFVGEGAVLSQDVTLPRGADRDVPGLER
jgi:hypothetical protein